MVVCMAGFREEFNTNKAALEKFLSAIESNIFVLLSSKYKDTNDITNMIHVADSLSVFKDKHKIRRFLFEKR